MKALGKLKKQKGLWLYNAPMPSIGPHDVLIKIRKTAICGTDLHIYKWDDWAQRTIPVPMTTGHEFMGQVAAVGSEVTRVKPGDRVSGEGHIICDICRNCREGKRHYCIDTLGIGVNRTGCFAEYLALPESNVVLLPKEISDDVASFLDPLGNAVHTTLAFDIIGEDVLITGAGPIGMMATAIAKHVGARRIVITDVNEFRLKMAKKMGATRTVNPSKENLETVMKELGMTEGFTVGLEMSGNPKAFNSMISAMNHGGKVAILGILPDGAGINWIDVIFKSLTLKGIYGRQMYGTWHKTIALLQSGLDIKPVITHSLPFTQFEKGFQIMEKGKSGKVILNWM